MFTITKPSLDDLPILTEIARQTIQESHGHSAAAEDMQYYLDHKVTQAALRAELLDERNIFYWVHYDGRPVGYSKIILDCPLDSVASPNVTKLERLYLLQELHGLQLGQRLFDFNIELAKAANQAGIWLYVWKGNHRAIAFYLKNGFQVVGEGFFKLSERHSNPNHIMFLGV